MKSRNKVEKKIEKKNLFLIFMMIALVLIVILIAMIAFKKQLLGAPCDENLIPQYYYNAQGSLIKIDYGLCGDYGIKSSNYFYDANENLIKDLQIINLHDNKYFYESTYTYDPLTGNLLSSSTPEQTVQYVYDPQNRLTREIINGIITTYDYENEISDRISCVNCQEASTDIPETYHYDANGNVVEYTYGASTFYQSFDPTNNNLQSKSGDSGDIGYVYDENGTLINMTTGEINYTINSCGTFDNYTYDENCTLTNDGTYNYTYDENGTLTNLTDAITGETTDYEYDLSLRLLKITNPDGSYLQYNYHPSDLYIVSDGTETHYLSPLDYSTMLTEADLLAGESPLLASCSGDCGEIPTPYSCSDEEQNGFEIGIDCGLSCWQDCNQTTDGCSYLSHEVIDKFDTYKDAGYYWDGEHRIHLLEAELANKSDWIVIPGYALPAESTIVKVQQITNQTTGYSNDKVVFIDVFSGETYTATLTGEGVGTVTIGGIVYNVRYFGAQNIPDEAKQVTINFQQTTSPVNMLFNCTAFTLPLSNGWNLISIPLNPINSTANNIFNPTIAQAIWQYNNPGGYVSPSNIQAKTGYWVKANLEAGQVENVKIYGTPLEDKTIQVNTGWNLIGVAGIQNYPYSELFVQAVWGYLAGEGYVVPYADLYEGRGYWLKASQPGTLFTQPYVPPIAPGAMSLLTPSGTCGNNIREGVEQCDGTDDKDCSGSCLEDCSCASAPIVPNIWCGNKKCESVENCSLCPKDCGTCPGVSTPVTTSGGGTSGVATTPTETPLAKIFSAASAQLASGYTQDLSAGEAISFAINNEQHSIIITSISSITVTITISSNPQQASLSAGQEKNFDVTGSNLEDISVKLNSITNNKASITLTSISQEYQEQQPGTTPTQPAKPTSFIFFIAAIIIILFVVVLIIYRKVKSLKQQ